VDVFKIEVFKIVLFIVAGLITLRIKAALSAPSRPLNTVIDGLAFTLVDHALNAFSHYPPSRAPSRLAWLALRHRASPVNSAKHSLMKMSYSQGRIRLFASSCGILRPMLASERGENGMSHERTERTRATETKRVPVETALGRKPIGRPPARVNPAPETHATSNRSQSHDQSKS